MPDNLSKRQPEDSKRVNKGQPYEISDWCKYFNCTEDQLRRAIKTVGTSVAALKQYFS